MLEREHQSKTSGHQTGDEFFGGIIAAHGNRDVNVSGEAGLAPDGDGQSANERPRVLSPIESVSDQPERLE
jgi:hypothetical protein